MTRTVCHLCHHPTSEPQTCQPCIARIRTVLNTVERLTILAPLELIARGAAATPPDPTGTRHQNDGLPTLMVMVGPGSTAWHEEIGTVDSIPGVLTKYEWDWRIALEERNVKGSTLVDLVSYLQNRMHHVAQTLPPSFIAEFRDDIRTLHHQLQAAFKDGPQRADIPCMECHQWTLERAAPNGRVIEYRCTYCHAEYDGDRWWLAVRAHGAPI